MVGTIFDIKEFALNDGPGMRVTVFMKGCPLACKWCHNPEGIDFAPQKNVVTGRWVGEKWTPERLVSYLVKFKGAYDLSDGGVTFSGGEPAAQSDFVMACAKLLKREGIHLNLDTSGYCEPEKFRVLIESFDLVFFDIKLVDEAQHRKMTGVSNRIIMENLKILVASTVPYHIRIPLVPKITDGSMNKSAITALIESLPRKPVSVDWLPYNVLAGAKYPNYGMTFPLKEVAGC